ncbi:hypothetical protein FS749_001736 [Ceratobasidium sp. UAMH 11750]|nr:hypothetical protein FS749_001736 [Ceratobasidium sp. UAMH 11750]
MGMAFVPPKKTEEDLSAHRHRNRDIAHWSVFVRLANRACSTGVEGLTFATADQRPGSSRSGDNLRQRLASAGISRVHWPRLSLLHHYRSRRAVRLSIPQECEYRRGPFSGKYRRWRRGVDGLKPNRQFSHDHVPLGAHLQDLPVSDRDSPNAFSLAMEGIGNIAASAEVSRVSLTFR